MPKQMRQLIERGHDSAEMAAGRPLPSPTAEDGLTYSLKQIVASNAVRADIRNTIAEAAARIERDAQEIARLTRLDALNVRDGNFLDSMWCCKVCDGEIPDGHTDECYIWKLEKRHRDFIANEYNAALRRAEALHTALRENSIRGVLNGWRCFRCKAPSWNAYEPERHIEGCLASPAETKE